MDTSFIPYFKRVLMVLPNFADPSGGVSVDAVEISRALGGAVPVMEVHPAILRLRDEGYIRGLYADGLGAHFSFTLA